MKTNLVSSLVGQYSVVVQTVGHCGQRVRKALYQQKRESTTGCSEGRNVDPHRHSLGIEHQQIATVIRNAPEVVSLWRHPWEGGAALVKKVIQGQVLGTRRRGWLKTSRVAALTLTIHLRPICKVQRRKFTCTCAVYWSQLTATIQCSLRPVSWDQFSIRVTKST